MLLHAPQIPTDGVTGNVQLPVKQVVGSCATLFPARIPA